MNTEHQRKPGILPLRQASAIVQDDIKKFNGHYYQYVEIPENQLQETEQIYDTSNYYSQIQNLLITINRLSTSDVRIYSKIHQNL